MSWDAPGPDLPRCLSDKDSGGGDDLGDRSRRRGLRIGLRALDAEVDAGLEVTGEVPGWLTARWSATARPGGRRVRGRRGQHVRHWFDGLAMLHRSPLQRVRELRQPPVYGDNASLNVTRLGGRLVALTESPEVVPFDPVTLATGAPLAFTDDLPGVVTTAHPHVDADRGVLLDDT